jgi:hypothetical protein
MLRVTRLSTGLLRAVLLTGCTNMLVAYRTQQLLDNPAEYERIVCSPMHATRAAASASRSNPDIATPDALGGATSHGIITDAAIRDVQAARRASGEDKVHRVNECSDCWTPVGQGADR